jgi:hypothetical protein
LKKIFLAALLLGAAFFVYREVVLEAPVRTFHAFAKAWGNEDTPAAVALTTGDRARDAVETRILRGVVRWPMEALRGSRQEIESRERSVDGTVVVAAKQFVYYDVPGVTSGVGGSSEAVIRHVARLTKTSEGWRVVEWTPTLLDAHPRRLGR